MSAKKYVIRVVIPAIDAPHSPPLAKPIDGAFLECLRYAGLVRVHHDDEDRQTFDLRPPEGGGDSKLWSEQNARRMATFGFNAVSAPATE